MLTTSDQPEALQTNPTPTSVWIRRLIYLGILLITVVLIGILFWLAEQDDRYPSHLARGRSVSLCGGTRDRALASHHASRACHSAGVCGCHHPAWALRLSGG